MVKFFIFLLFVVVVASQDGSDWKLTVEQRWNQYGFGYEEYKVTTQDGYILTLMRIPASPNDLENASEQSEKQPILLVHELLDSSEAFTRLGPDQSLAFYLSNQGFDVWMNNIRGNTLSRDHETLNPDVDREYWQYYWDDIRYDLMANIQFIIDNTSAQKVPIFGHSLGASFIAMALALEPEFFSDNVSVAFLASAAISLEHTNSPLYSILGNYPIILQNLWNLGVNVIGERNALLNWVIHEFWSIFTVAWEITVGLILGERNVLDSDPQGLISLVSKGAYGIGIPVIQHFVQSVRTKDVTLYDFGPEENLAHYGQPSPPPIDFTATNTPIALLLAEFDEVNTQTDLEWYHQRISENIIFEQTYSG